MPGDSTANLGLTYLRPNQRSKEIIINENFNIIDLAFRTSSNLPKNSPNTPSLFFAEVDEDGTVQGNASNLGVSRIQSGSYVVRSKDGTGFLNAVVFANAVYKSAGDSIVFCRITKFADHLVVDTVNPSNRIAEDAFFSLLVIV